MLGKFLSLDLGGTNFRVIVMEITEDREFLMDSKIYAVPEDIMRGMSLKIVIILSQNCHNIITNLS